jgi:hypothetical protein
VNVRRRRAAHEDMLDLVDMAIVAALRSDVPPGTVRARIALTLDRETHATGRP